MIDRKPAGERKKFWKKSADPAGEFQEHRGISNKAMVYLVIIVLIVILCIVYGMQLRDARRGGQAQEQAATTADTAAAAAPAEEAAEAPAAEAAEAPAEEAAQ